MRSIEASMRYQKRKTPWISDFVAFGRDIRGRDFTSRAIKTNLRLIDPDDYDGLAPEDVMNHFLMLTKSSK